MNNEYLFCGRWYRPDYIDAHRSSIDLQPPLPDPPHRGRESDAEDEGRGEGGKRGTEAPPDPPILADAKGGRRTEGRERADDSIVLKKKKEARQRTKGEGDRAKGIGEGRRAEREERTEGQRKERREKEGRERGGERKGDSGTRGTKIRKIAFY